METKGEGAEAIKLVVNSIDAMRLGTYTPDYTAAYHKYPSVPKEQVTEAIDMLDAERIERLVTTTYKTWNVNETNEVDCQPVLKLAVMTDRSDIIQAVLKHPLVDINLFAPVPDTTALMSSCIRKHSVALRTLLADPRLNPNIKDRGRFTALHYAMNYGYLDQVKEFIASGIKFDVPEDLWGHYTILGSTAEDTNRKQDTARKFLRLYQANPEQVRSEVLISLGRTAEVVPMDT
jgi:hypothetical protein